MFRNFITFGFVMIFPFLSWAKTEGFCSGNLLPGERPFSTSTSPVWDRIAERLGKEIFAEMQKQADVILVLDAMGMPTVERLIKFGFLHNRSEVRRPPFAETGLRAATLLQNMNLQKQAYLDRGGLLESFIEPGFLFQQPGSNEILILPFGAEVPYGYEPVLDLESGLLDSETFLKFLSQGFQTVQLKPNGFFAYHEISHMIGYYSSDEFMDQARATARFGFRNQWASFFIAENFAHPDGQFLRQLFDSMGFGGIMNCNSEACVEELIGSKQPEVAMQMHKNIYRMLRPYGGALLGANTAAVDQNEFENFAPAMNPTRFIESKPSALVYHLILLSRLTLKEHADMILNGPNDQLCKAYQPIFTRETPKDFISLFCKSNPVTRWPQIPTWLKNLLH